MLSWILQPRAIAPGVSKMALCISSPPYSFSSSGFAGENEYDGICDWLPDRTTDGEDIIRSGRSQTPTQTQAKGIPHQKLAPLID